MVDTDIYLSIHDASIPRINERDSSRPTAHSGRSSPDESLGNQQHALATCFVQNQIGILQRGKQYGIINMMFLMWYEEGKFPLDKLVTRCYKLYDFNEACDALKSGDILGRAIIGCL